MSIAVAISLWGTRAHAQQEGLAESLFREARENMKHGEPERACPKFEESYRLDPAIGTLLNLGLCQQKLGHVATAWTKLRQFVDAAPVDDSRVPRAKKTIAELEAEIPKIRILVAQDAEQGVVQLDGVELRAASLGVDLRVDPGDHVIVLTMPSGARNETRVRVDLGETVATNVSRPADEAQKPEAAKSPNAAVRGGTSREPVIAAPQPSVAPRASTRSTSHGTERAVAYSAVAAGAAGLVVSGIFGIFALSDKQTVRDHCPDHVCRDPAGLDATRSGSRDESIANIFGIAGAATLATGAVLWWHSGRSSIALSGGPASASLSLSGAFP